MRFLSNIYDPHREDARERFTFSSKAASDHELANLEWERQMGWVNENIIDRPMATDKYTVGQLEEFGMVGIYAPS